MQLTPSSKSPAVSSPKIFWLSLAALTIAFIGPFTSLVRFALHNELYSYVLLVPAVSLYLAWQRRGTAPTNGKSMSGLAWVPLAIGAALFIWYVSARLSNVIWATQDSLALTISTGLFWGAAFCIRYMDTSKLLALAFPLGFLVFMVPLPVIAETNLETFLQHGSALAAQFFFTLAGTTVFVDQLTFQLPGITLMIAPECSGIHSSLVLLITSLLAGYLFLRSPGKRAVLALAVIPLALLRNGLRVFVIGELCVRIGPEMIDSYIHHHGGPIFFVLSLIPFSLLLVILVKSESKTSARVVSTQPPPS